VKIAPVGLIAAVALVLGAGPSVAATSNGWNAPAVLGHLQSNTGYGASTAATNPKGASIVVWSALQGHKYRYLAATRQVGGVWSKPHVLAQNVQDGRIFADISASGRATAIWTTAVGSGVVHFATHSGSRWSANRVLAGSNGFNASSFAKAPNGYGVLAGNKEVRVNRNKPLLSVAYVRKLKPSGQWGPQLRVSSRTLPRYQGKTHAGTGASDVQAAIDGAGSVITAWGWSYFQDPSGAFTRLQRNNVGTGGKVGKVVNLKPTPQFRLGVESVQMSPSGNAAIVWNDDESKTAYILVKTSTGPWVSTTRDISSLGIADDVTFFVNDAVLSEYWVKTVAGTDSTTLTLYAAAFRPEGWTPSIPVDSDTVAGSDQISSNGLYAASGADNIYLLWGTQDITKFLADQPSDTSLLTVYPSTTPTLTQHYPVGTTSEALAAGGEHATALIGRHVAGAIAPDLVAVSR
jgi:hypothetical protein